MYNASMIWGTIGPQRMFQSGQVYNALMYFFILGVSTSSIFSVDQILIRGAACRHCHRLSTIPTLP